MIFTAERQAASLAIFKARKAEKAINPPDYSSYTDEETSYEDGWTFYDKEAVSSDGFQTFLTSEIPSPQPSQPQPCENRL